MAGGAPLTSRLHAWHSDAILRLAGALLCAGGGVSLAQLIALRPLIHGPIGYALATIAFVGASLGSALTALGHHIFDHIDVGARSPASPAGDPW